MMDDELAKEAEALLREWVRIFGPSIKKYALPHSGAEARWVLSNTEATLRKIEDHSEEQE